MKLGRGQAGSKALAALALGLITVAGGACQDDALPEGGPVTLTYYRHDDIAVAAADTAAIARYQAAHPDVKIDVKELNYNALVGLLEAELRQGTLPADLVNMPPSYACGYADQLAPVPDEVMTTAQATASFLGPPLDGVTCRGRLVGLPREFNLEYGGILVNMTRYRAKLPGRSPADWKTWADVISDAQQLTERDAQGKVTVAGLDFRHRAPVKHILLSLILQRGGQYWSGDDRARFQFNTPQAEAAVQWMVDAALTHRYLDPEGPASVTGPWALALVQERAAMVYVGTWGHAIATAALADLGKNVELGYFAHPPFLGTEHVYVQNSGWSLVVPRSSPRAAAAMDFLKFVTTEPGNVRDWNRLAGSISPLRAHATPEALAGDPVVSKIQPLLMRGAWVGYIPPVPLTETRDSWYNSVVAAMRGKVTTAEGGEKDFTATDAAARMHQECNDSMDRARL
jgi:multiple sugar transport system substrate-binding protein